MIIIADAHVDAAGNNVSDFFQMLQAIEKTDHDVIFLGDIFDLWVALPRYEKDIHRAFSRRCAGGGFLPIVRPLWMEHLRTREIPYGEL